MKIKSSVFDREKRKREKDIKTESKREKNVSEDQLDRKVLMGKMTHTHTHTHTHIYIYI
jgi:hypothetical protein